MEKVFSSFKHVEIIFGCEGVLNSDISTIMASQIINIEKIVKSKSAAKIADRIKDGSIDIRVSRDTKSHEKIFILKAEDGRTRVICGSANMSASAFLGIQRENIVYFDDQEAFDYYKKHFDNLKDKCSDTLSEKVIAAIQEDDDYIRDNIQEVPILQTIKKNDVVILEPTSTDTDDVEIVASINGLEAEIKPLIPKIKPEKGKILLTSDKIKTFKKKYDEQLDIKKVRAKQLPKLHIDYDNKKLLFNDKEFNLNPDKESIQKDISSMFNFIDSLSTFYGDYKKSQNDYYRFLNWYFCSPFMPYLRYIGSKYDYSIFSFPVFGILYGESNGGKTTFIKLLSKMMTGAKVNLNTSEDFTATRINGLKSVCQLPCGIAVKTFHI